MRVRLVWLVASALVLVGSAAAFAEGLPPGGTFFDDDGNTHEGNIEAIAAQGITRGCNPPQNTSYCPGDPVTRGQMAAFMHRALDTILTPGDPVEFVDDDGSTFEADIEWLGATGVTRGCNPPANDRYCPDDFVTRGQMAAFIHRGFDEVLTPSELVDFIDDDGSTFEADISWLGGTGVTVGCNPPANDRYCPDDLVKRDQMASFLARALGLAPIPPEPRADTALGSQVNLLIIAGSQGCPIGSLQSGVTEVCSAKTTISGGQQFYIAHGHAFADWSQLTESQKQVYMSDQFSFRLELNGVTLDTFESFEVDADDVGHKVFRFQFPGTLSTGAHTLVAEWTESGFVELRVTLHLTIEG